MIGRLLDGRYRVGSRVARGGMATVYEATDIRLDRVCALKVMHPNLGDDEDFAGRFVREARSAARLSHPNVVAVFDQGDDDGTLFQAMEYLPGHTLRDLIRKEAPMAPAKALSLLEPVLSALGAAHAAGMIHRDVKPENVLLADDGRIKVADFGLARAVSAETQHTGTGGVLIGTVSYLSPELVVDGRADARADVYAAGVLLYEMLTGRKPHEGESPIQVAYKHVHEDVPPPSRLVPGIPAYVDALVARATARDRERRPADARVLLHQVRRVRAALDQRLDDDPELTADLTPTAVVPTEPSIDYVRDEAPVIVEPEALGAGTETTTALHRPVPARAGRPGGGGGSRTPEGPARTSRRRRSRGPLLLALVLLLAAIAGVAGWWFGLGRYTATPGVINLPQARAEQRIEQAGLSFRVEGTTWSETVAKGSVVRTDPAPGSRILEDGTVSAVLSRGPERYAVPTLRGMSEDRAKQALADHHLAFGDAVRRFNEKVSAGVVLGTRPEAGAELKRDTAVDLVVSKGPRPIEVRDFTGKDADKATRWADRAGLVAQVTHQHDAEVPKGTVISQDPAEGELFKGDAVRLLVSDGPEMVQIPEVKGVGIDEATSRLEAAGFEVETQHADIYVGLEYVVGCDPGQGSMAPRGSVVTLTLV
jgi:serine/threonine-protein kinase